MLRKMCKICARKSKEDIYKRRKLTGIIVGTERKGKQVKKIIRCTRCGNSWCFYQKK